MDRHRRGSSRSTTTHSARRTTPRSWIGRTRSLRTATPATRRPAGNVNDMSAPPSRVPRASGATRVVRSKISPWERLLRIIRYHELLVGMVRKELKIKYKNSVLGFAWSLLNPLLYLVVFYIAFEKILHNGFPGFPIWLLSGLLV